eukprot:2258543-Pyramimonas_sp.AAC.1
MPGGPRRPIQLIPLHIHGQPPGPPPTPAATRATHPPERGRAGKQPSRQPFLNRNLSPLGRRRLRAEIPPAPRASGAAAPPLE